MVSNAFGVTTSAVATLTITNPPAPPPPSFPVYDAFPYEPGSNLEAQGGWVLNAGTSPVIESGNLEVAGLAPPAGNRLTWSPASMSLRLPLGTNVTSGAIYFSFALRADTLGPSFNSEGTLAGFTTGTGTSFGTKINIRTNGGGGFNLGVSKLTGTTYGAWATNSFAAGERVFVVGRYRFNNTNGTDDLCDLWLNPSCETLGAATPPAATIGDAGAGGVDLSQIDRFFFRGSGSAASPAKLTADELRVGLSWASVTPPAPPELRVASASNAVVLSWPTNAAVFVLQGSPTLAPAPVWQTETIAPQASGTNYNIVVQTTNAVRFFRLAQQN